MVTATLLTGCGGQPQLASLVEQSRLAMGSSLRVAVWSADSKGAARAIDQVYAEFDRLDRILSVWQPGSEVQRLNAAAGRGPVPVGPDLRTVLQTAAEASRRTGGKFDITFGALADIWKFDQDQDNTIPDEAAIARRLPFIDYRKVEVDDAAGTAYIARKGMRIHLGGIGKGYAVDRAVAILHKRGLDDFIIQAGGDMYAGGLKGDRPWRLGIRNPRGPEDKIFAAIDLSNGTFSTSGDYERAFLSGGVRYHHILDPATGQPARGCRSVTLVTARAVFADALAKGVFILGAEKGLALIERLPDVEGVIVSDKNEVLVSSGLKDRVTLLTPPTDAP